MGHRWITVLYNGVLLSGQEAKKMIDSLDIQGQPDHALFKKVAPDSWIVCIDSRCVARETSLCMLSRADRKRGYVRRQDIIRWLEMNNIQARWMRDITSADFDLHSFRTWSRRSDFSGKADHAINEASFVLEAAWSTSHWPSRYVPEMLLNLPVY